MKKIPTIFERDWDGDRSRVVSVPNPECAWVFAGEGTAFQKLDGMCCAVINGRLHKRREVKAGQPVPTGFLEVDHDDVTGKRVGWVPISYGPEDKYFREAWDLPRLCGTTYELVGPKSQGNPEDYPCHLLVSHHDSDLIFDDQPPRTFDGLREWMEGRDVEGIVWHHSDGRMAKIKLRDFGLKRIRARTAWD